MTPRLQPSPVLTDTPDSVVGVELIKKMKARFRNQPSFGGDGK